MLGRTLHCAWIEIHNIIEWYTKQKLSVEILVHKEPIGANIQDGGGVSPEVVLPLQLLIESSQRSVRILHVLLCLFPHVEDWTILARA